MGAGAFIAGQVISAGVSYEDLFLYSGFASFVSGTVTILLYYAFGKRYEKKAFLKADNRSTSTQEIISYDENKVGLNDMHIQNAYLFAF